MEIDNQKYLKLLVDTPPWEWPRQTQDRLQKILSDPQAAPAERLTAADLAGDFTAINDKLAEVLLRIIGSPAEREELRGQAAISLGPALEAADQAFGDWDDVPISESMFQKIQKTLHEIYDNQANPKLVRRRVLEAAVRAPEEWQNDAIRSAYGSGDRDWVLTAVFAMREIDGFDDEILEALNSTDNEIHFEAVVAAGNAELAAAWPHILKVLQDKDTPKELLLGAIEAAGSIKPEEATDVLDPFTDSRDEDIAAAAHEAISMANSAAEFDDDFDEDEDEEE